MPKVTGYNIRSLFDYIQKKHIPDLKYGEITKGKEVFRQNFRAGYGYSESWDARGSGYFIRHVVEYWKQNNKYKVFISITYPNGQVQSDTIYLSGDENVLASASKLFDKLFTPSDTSNVQELIDFIADDFKDCMDDYISPLERVAPVEVEQKVVPYQNPQSLGSFTVWLESKGQHYNVALTITWKAYGKGEASWNWEYAYAIWDLATEGTTRNRYTGEGSEYPDVDSMVKSMASVLSAEYKRLKFRG